MAKVLTQLERVIARYPDERIGEVARIHYNMSADPAFQQAAYGDRVAELHKRLGDGYSAQSVRRGLSGLLRDVEVSLTEPSPRIPLGELHAVMERERDPAADFRRAVRDLHRPEAPARRAVDAFLSALVHVPHDAADAPTVVHTASLGPWVLAFTQRAWLDDYHRRAGSPPFRASHRMPGLELLRLLTERHPDVGVLVDPSADRDPDPTETTSLPPRVIREIIEAN
ncbi:hypothetical protein F0L68_13175 [Solihabitans fulvus]|uniref:Uncharacterized protein n=2 Tax=Solihabitans fulvus TaxID=1892852 RepID=A0A5B2XGR6_9PSEU|nr:hypothetical protein F0L68_13175 [Solihabitans fulvus]